MHHWKTVVLLAIILVTPLTVSAQNQVTIETLEVQLWPEYDRPEMLVIYYLELSTDTRLPAEVSFRIPIEAGRPHVIAVGQSISTASDKNVDHSQQVQGNWLYVFVTATGPAVVFEYYLPIEKQLKTRHFEFDWLSEYDITNLVVKFKEPSDGKSLRSNIPLEDLGVATDNLFVHGALVGNVPAGEQFNWAITYDKATDDLYISGGDLQTTGEIPGTSVSDYLPWLLGIVGVVLIVGGGLSFYLTGRGQGQRVHRRHASLSRKKNKQPVSETGAGLYCHQCGRRAQSGDRFCRDCGKRLRREEE
ncbi:MAG: zinc ribbon domain-containing protein [Anaerolineales bacterium]|nr:zinc ribbon domain-containing protein [Anaerolineales bacterium]